MLFLLRSALSFFVRLRCHCPRLEMFCCISDTACLYNTDGLLTSHPFHLLRQVKIKDRQRHTYTEGRTKRMEQYETKKKLFPNPTYICCRPKDQPFNQGRSLISGEGGQLCLLEIYPWEEEKGRKYYRRNKIDFSSFHHHSFLFPFSTSEPRWYTFFFCHSYHAVHQTRFAVKAAPRLHLSYCSSVSEAGCFLPKTRQFCGARSSMWRRCQMFGIVLIPCCLL